MRFFIVIFMLFLNILLPALCHAEVHVGYRSLSTWNSGENVRLDVGLWYPTQSTERYYVMEDFHVYVAKNAPIYRIIDDKIASPALEKHREIKERAKAEKLSKEDLQKELDKFPIPYKKYPLIILSHASGSTRYSYHTLADNLVKQGYIVAVPMHSMDNAHDMRSFYSAKSLYQRARQCSLTVDLLLTEKFLSSIIDSEKISFVGFGSGGSAGLLLAGADLSSANWFGYCSEEETGQEDSISDLWTFDAKDKEENVLCKEPIKTQLNNFALGLQATMEKSSLENSFFYNAMASANALQDEVKNIFVNHIKWVKRSNPGLADYIYEPPFVTPYLPPLPTKQTYHDTRFRNFVFVSVGLVLFYDLKKIQNDLAFCIVGLENDFINKDLLQSQVLYNALSEQYDRKNVEYHFIKDADLWSTQAPCYGVNVLGEICKSVSEEERKKILDKLSKIIERFLPEME